MEPSITADGNTMFFNSLNDGITTSLYHATKINDSTFNYAGPLSGANQTVSPRLDGVASSDSANNFFWVSLRDYPNQFDNYFRGYFNGTNIVTIGRTHGTFYIYNPGWLIMDAAINYQGNLLYYCNARFGCGPIPCEAKLGIAQKQNDSTFNKLLTSDGVLQQVNDTNYLVYAPFITKDGLELYYTRILKSNPFQTEMLVSVRSSQTHSFSVPAVIIPSSSAVPEGPTLTSDGSKLYYHKKVGSQYKLFLRYRLLATGFSESENNKSVLFFPNPASTVVQVKAPKPYLPYSIEVYSEQGKEVLRTTDKIHIDLSHFPPGIYLFVLKQENNIYKTKLLKQHAR